MKNSRNNKRVILVGLLGLFLVHSCTDLEPSLDDSVLAEDNTGAFTGVDPESFLASAYDDIEGLGDQTNAYALSEVTSDEMVVVTRGADWGDNGIWRTLHQHTWSPEHLYILQTWNNRNASVLRCTQIIAPESNATDSQLAEAKLLRAINMFLVMDFFGQVPFREVDEGVDVDPKVFSREEAFAFIEKDLNEALPNLPEAGPAQPQITGNKALAHFMLAKLYLNKEVYTGSISVEDYTKVVENCDAITDAGYTLDEDYFGIFLPEHENKEIIFALDTWTGNRVWNVLNSQQGGWNGFSTLAEVYDSFDENDIRLGDPGDAGVGKGMLIGQQFAPDGTPLRDRTGTLLVFTKEYPTGISGNNERTGVRPMKYTNKNDEGAPSPANGTVFARYADVILMKAEAILKGGNSSETGESILDELRTIRGVSALGSYSMEELLNERRRELYVEGWRRNDQIRFDAYNRAWDMKETSEEFRKLFPIPGSAVASNPNLVQNPGY